MMIKLWVDDIRPAPDGWTLVRSVNEFEYQISKAILFGYFSSIKEISFDHDAGEFAHEGGDYIECLNWLEEVAFRYTEKGHPLTLPHMTAHSMNPVGRQKIEQIIERIQKYT